MPFIAYKWKKDSRGFRIFERLDDVKLAGHGLIASYIRELYKTKSVVPLPWHIAEDEFLTQLGKSAEQHALIIEPVPAVKNNVSLYQLKDIWGFSYENWTPIAFRLETLFVNEDVEDSDKFKQKFNDEKCKRQQVHEFRSLQGGVKAGVWCWGRLGLLLWPDAVNYFMEALTDSLKSHRVI